MGVIKVSGINVYAYHGCMPEETKIGGKYIVNVELYSNLEVSCISDNLKDTIDYVRVNEIVEEEMAIPSKLIEHVGYRILKRLKQEFRCLEKAVVNVVKLSPPINGNVNEVSICIEG